jgi:hypothetical protein
VDTLPEAEKFFVYFRKVLRTLCFVGPQGRECLLSQRFTGFLGFLMLTYLVPYLVRRLGKLAVYRISQDHIEFLFGDIRRGINNNPDAAVFPYLLRKSMLLQGPDCGTGNCILSVSFALFPSLS